LTKARYQRSIEDSEAKALARTSVPLSMEIATSPLLSLTAQNDAHEDTTP
jgi:hypothetical protein